MKKKNSDNQLKMPLNDVEMPLSNGKKRKSMINVRGAFSESTGIGGCNMQMQYNDFNDRSRILISNQLRELLEFLFEKCVGVGCVIQYRNSYSNNGADDFSRFVLSKIFVERINLKCGYEYDWRCVFDRMHNVITEAPYNEVLDIIELSCVWLAQNYSNHHDIMYDAMNEVFEEEYIGYRFIGEKIAPITDENEIKEIESACNNPFEGCRSHIQKAVDFLADREHKDYKNCIKESICAVESICKIIVGDENADLAKAIKKLKDNGLQLHSALELAFIKLYAYTSDKGGIRHSEGMFESNVTFEEAKYMLISCSAFVNYLVAEYGKLGGKND